MTCFKCGGSARENRKYMLRGNQLCCFCILKLMCMPLEERLVEMEKLPDNSERYRRRQRLLKFGWGANG